MVTGALGASAFTVYAIGAAASPAGPGRALGAHAAVLALLAGLTVFAVLRIRADDRRADAVLTRTGAGLWLPPGDDAGGDAETRRLRVLGVRAAGIAMLWFGVLLGTTSGLAQLDDAAEHLLVTGARTTGVVESVHDPTKGTPSMRVRFEVNGRSRTAEIVRDTGRRYRPGEEVTVVYDRDDPAHVRTVEEPNGDQHLTGLFVVPLLLALVAVPWSVVSAGNWWRRYRAVRHTGWRAATVTVVADYPVRKGRHRPDIQVRYGDGSRMVLRAAASSHGATVFHGRRNLEARVGGWGRGMVVLFPHTRLRKRPYAVPAYALSERRRAG